MTCARTQTINRARNGQVECTHVDVAPDERARRRRERRGGVESFSQFMRVVMTVARERGRDKREERRDSRDRLHGELKAWRHERARSSVVLYAHCRERRGGV